MTTDNQNPRVMFVFRINKFHFYEQTLGEIFNFLNDHLLPPRVIRLYFQPVLV